MPPKNAQMEEKESEKEEKGRRACKGEREGVGRRKRQQRMSGRSIAGEELKGRC